MLSESTWVNVISIFITFCLGVITLFRWRYTFWKRIGLPSTVPKIPFGDMKECFSGKKHPGEVVTDIYNRAKAEKHRHIGAFVATAPVYIPVDPEIIKHIVQKDFNCFPDRDSYVNERDDPLSANLLMLNGEKWKYTRQKLTPTFTSGQIKMMFQTILECGKNLEMFLEQRAETNEPMDIKDVLARFTTDTIVSCGFGLECDTLKDPDSDFRKHGRLVFNETLLQHLKMLLGRIAPHKFLNFIGFCQTPKEPAEFFLKIIEDTVHYRETNNVRRKDFMDLLLQLKNQGELQENEKTTNGNDLNNNNSSSNGKIVAAKLTMNELAAQCFIFFLAGFETSSTTMNFALYELVQNQELQDKVREEIRTVLERHGGQISYEAVQEMQLLANVVDESLRKYPPVPVTSRICTRDYVIPDSEIVLKQGTKVFIPILGLHRDPEYYPNPDVFDPDRFLAENKQMRPSFTYLPFGGGPRTCIGLRFGLMQSKIGLVHLLKNYKYIFNPKTQRPFSFHPHSFVLSPKHDIWLNVVREN